MQKVRNYKTKEQNNQTYQYRIQFSYNSNSSFTHSYSHRVQQNDQSFAGRADTDMRSKSCFNLFLFWGNPKPTYPALYGLT